MSTSTAPQPPADPRPITPAASTKAPAPQFGGRFARLPALAGRRFLPVGLFARLPLAMLTLGTLTLATSVTGSYAVGGAAAGAVGIGSAVGAPILGWLADRFGQRPVLLISAGLNVVAVLAVIATAYLLPGVHDVGAAWGVIAAALAAGLSCPQVGPLARVRWMALTAESRRAGDSTDLDVALSYESTADELTFVLGPALVGVLASLVAPWLPLAVAAALTLTLVPAFAVHRTHTAVPRRPATGARAGTGSTGSGSAGTRDGSRLAGLAPVALPVLAMVCMGTFFGSTQAALSAFAAGVATSEAAGLLYAVMGVSSAAAAISVAYWPAGFPVTARWVTGAAAMAGLSALLFLPTDGGGMVLVLLALGLPVGPVMVTVFAIGGLVAPAGRLATVMTALASGIVAGTALGSSIGGQLAQEGGHQAAFVVSAAAAAALFALGTAAAVVVLSRKRSAQAS
ncbi:MFS family permease [Arthrobacter globiformis]|uniref:MFS transporter n=1 Tax=Arthrobacter globiformis TaxID=1665 RepID=UPI002789E151|nr:MFS transporter [Arthrobacter globiformis]MDQ1059253.1 MFS family permease [Arthrobacter globiformis]